MERASVVWVTVGCSVVDRHCELHLQPARQEVEEAGRNVRVSEFRVVRA